MASYENTILTKDNLIQRKWQGHPSYAFCDDNESINHLFFESAVAKYTWSIVVLL